MTVRSVRHVAGPFFLVLLSVPALYSQCADTNTQIYTATTATRINGNQVKLMNQTTISGDYSNWWQPDSNISFYFGSTLEANSGWQRDPSTGGTWSNSYSPTLQTYGPDTYSITAAADAWTTYCGGGMYFSQYCNLYGCTVDPPWDTGNAITIQRPGRPDYVSGATHYLWYLGGNAADRGYNAVTAFAPGAANGAPEQPTYVIVSGANELSLSCTNCNYPVATAIGWASDCQTYDVIVKTSYSGFLSDAFWIFINRPWNLVAANDQPDPDDGWCDPSTGPWVYSCALYNGWETHVNYETYSLCATDPAMNNYDVNEQFPWGWAGDPPANWEYGGPTSYNVAKTQWVDDISMSDWGAAPGDPATCDLVPGVWVPCIPSFTLPGVGPHTLVLQAQQNWFVGNWVIGSGARVQSDALQKYTDSGWHTNIITPNP